MYKTIKFFINKLVPKKIMFRYEPVLRKVYAVFFKGKEHQCNVCNYNLSKFIILPNKDKLCPNCGSLSRDRRLWQLLKTEFLKENQKILDFSPSRCLSRKLKTIKTIDYKSTDLSGNFNADYKYDITKLDIPDNTLDLIICYHILEHIEDDQLAMHELFRVLKPSGKAIVQTPYKDGEIYENVKITTPKERLIHFGQEDHVRIYSEQGLKNRLESSGFEVQIRHFMQLDTFLELSNEAIFILTKTTL